MRRKQSRSQPPKSRPTWRIRPIVRRKQSQLPPETDLNSESSIDAYHYWSNRVFSENERMRHSVDGQVALFPQSAPFILMDRDMLRVLLRAAVSNTPLRIPPGADVKRVKRLSPVQTRR